MADRPAAPDRNQRSESRRQQVLDAAARCFRRSGFRGASIAAISAEAGMSTGHIYHYFRNKEAIVEAIVERDMENDAERIKALRQAPPEELFETMMRTAKECMVEPSPMTEPALLLEIAAEASRNPLVAAILGKCKRTVHQQAKEILEFGQEHGAVAPDLDLDGICLLVSTLFDGITAQSVINPLFRAEKIMPHMETILRALLLRD